MTTLEVGSVVGPGRLVAKTSLDRMCSDHGNESWILGEPTYFERTNFFVDDQIDLELAENGGTFLNPAFRKGLAQGTQVVCSGRLSVIGGDGVVLYQDRPVYDSLFDLATWEAQSNGSSFEAGRSVTLKAPIEVSRSLRGGPYLIGFNGRYTNYCHWLQQMNPWHFAFMEVRKKHPGARLVLPPFGGGLFRYQTLSILGITEEEIVIVHDKEIVSFESAIACGRFDLWTIPPYCVDAARALADRVPPIDDAKSERIYVHRSVRRRVFSSFDEHRPLLERYGFRIVEFENMSVRNQINTLRNARYIIAEHGAGMINLLFCQPGARVLELFNPACVQPAYWSIASACGLDYGFAVGVHVPTADYPTPGWNSAYSLTREKLVRAIDALVSK